MSDPAAFDELIGSISELESEEFLEQLASDLGRTVDDLIQSGFTRASDPYGAPWAPRKLARNRTSPPHLPLQETGEMRGNFHITTSSAGVKVTNPVLYSPFHQGGTRFMAAREMLPDDRGLGEWEEPLQATAMRLFAKTLNQGVV